MATSDQDDRPSAVEEFREAAANGAFHPALARLLGELADSDGQRKLEDRTRQDQLDAEADEQAARTVEQDDTTGDPKPATPATVKAGATAKGGNTR